MELPDFALIIPAAGIGKRMGTAEHKPYLTLDDKSIIMHTLEAFQDFDELQYVIVVINESDIAVVECACEESFMGLGVNEIVVGGATRAESVMRGLASVPDHINIVVVHDVVRPFVSRETIEQTVLEADKHGAAIAATKVCDTLKKANSENIILETIDRDDTWLAQTPQAFHTKLLIEAVVSCDDATKFTDEASLIEAAGHKVKIVPSPAMNFKITTPEDLEFARIIFKGRKDSQ